MASTGLRFVLLAGSKSTGRHSPLPPLAAVMVFLLNELWQKGVSWPCENLSASISSIKLNVFSFCGVHGGAINFCRTQWAHEAKEEKNPKIYVVGLKSAQKYLNGLHFAHLVGVSYPIREGTVELARLK